MKCSVCGQNDHNRRTCPNIATGQKLAASQLENRDRSILLRIDNLTAGEQEQVQIKIRDLKRTIAPDARATLVEGKTSELPSKIQELINSNANQTLLPPPTE